MDLGGPVMDVKHFLVERFLEKLVVVEGVEVVVERSGLVLVVHGTPLKVDFSCIVGLEHRNLSALTMLSQGSL